MPVMLDRVDSVPVDGNELTSELKQWLTNLVDNLNSIIGNIETAVNQVVAPSFTTAQITALALTAPNGSFWYDTDTNQIKALSNGVVVVIA